MFIAAAFGCGVLGVVIERFAYRPLRDAPRIAPLITALGVSFILENSVLLLFGGFTKSYSTNSFIPSTRRHQHRVDQHRPGPDHHLRRLAS